MIPYFSKYVPLTTVPRFEQAPQSRKSVRKITSLPANMSSPSIQSFFTKPIAVLGSANPTKVPHPDGFTQEELDAPTSPLARAWRPTVTYREISITDIVPGPGNISFSGRIVNYRPSEVDKIGGQYSRPWHFLVIKDDTGVLGVKLTPIGIPVATFVLGRLVTVWATYIGTPSSTPCTIPYMTSCTSVNPERGTKQFIRFFEDTSENDMLHRVPLGSGLSDEPLRPLPDLMTLGTYGKTGHDDVRGVMLLVCVSSVGRRRQVRKAGRDEFLELIEVIVCDNTGSCVFTLWEDKINSARAWTPNKTILLIVNPKRQNRRGSGGQVNIGIGIDNATLVDVEPRGPDADWLRGWAKDRLKKEAVCIAFPDNIWNAEEAVNGPIRALFTVAEVDEFVRSDSQVEFTGKLSLIIVDMELTSLWQRKMLCCTECCGVPLYANISMATCQNCRSPQHLSFNPRIMGTLVDETGCIEKGKLMWSLDAWKQLLLPDGDATSYQQTNDLQSDAASPGTVVGDHPNCTNMDQIWVKLTEKGAQSIRSIEDQLLYSRVTLTFGWAPAIERLCILGVEW